ncbi:MAG: type II toxin-antitoxin system prevent-host-death family antitoxin [Actinomycetota bacterium]|nr:type II toxin-antitoxin system prevent-host-death family antitoxin [Actinomycetota bacterium]
MDRVGVRELRLNASELLRRVAAGESIEITKRGRVIALLAPARAGDDVRQHLIDTGQLIPGRGRLREVEPKPVTASSISQALAEMRADER